MTAYERVLSSLDQVTEQVNTMEDGKFAIIQRLIDTGSWDGYSSYDCTLTEIPEHITESHLQKHNVTLSANPPNLGYVTGGGKYYHNNTITVNAIPTNFGYFANWSDGGARTHNIQVVGDMSLTANFREASCIAYDLQSPFVTENGVFVLITEQTPIA